MKIDLCSCDSSHGKVCGCGKPMCQQCCFAAHPTCPCSCPGCTPDPSWTQRYPHTCQPACDCPLDPHHRWNCALTPVWAQTMRDMNVNPWTVIKPFEMQLPKENQ